MNELTSPLLIRGGVVVDPVSGVDGPRDLLIRDGVVAGVELPGAFDEVEAVQTLDAKGCIVAPGLVDVHVHLREPGQTYKETIATGTAAAAAGGFTSVVAMPNTLPVNDRPASLRWMLSPERNPLVRLFAMPAATVGSMGQELTDFEALAEAGAVGFTDDGKPILDGIAMREALLRAGRLGLPVSQHAEDTHISPSSGINAGPVAFRLGLRGMTVEAEARIVERDIRLVREIEKAEGVRCHLHVQHISTARALRAIRNAKADGLRVTCEAAPHHFTLTDAAIGCFDTHCKMNPPLRSDADREAVVAGLLDGTIDCIATDHAPHARHEKEVEFASAPNGITGLETALGLALRVLHREHGAPLARIVQLMSAAPTAIVSLQRAGSLGVGQWGDAVVFDAEREWHFAAAKSKSKSKNTPFDGAAMLGQVRATVVAGKIVYREDIP
jgi:dihydroorotase